MATGMCSTWYYNQHAFRLNEVFSKLSNWQISLAWKRKKCKIEGSGHEVALKLLLIGIKVLKYP